MKKKFYGALLLGSLFLAGGMVSCSDYDDDINSLTQRVDALEKTVAELQKAIEAGAVITNVQSTENGVTVTLSDGKTFEVKNGAKGEDGEDGSVIAIKQVDGVDYWFLDGKNTGYPVKGEKGDDGNDGNDGSDGVDGKDGCWYFPYTDGYWHKQYYNEEGEIVDEATDQPWIPSAKETVRVVYDSVNGRLLISNAEGMQEGEVLVIETWGELKSLAVIPYVIDKETSMPVVSFYNIVKDGEVLESTDATAHFRLNPNNASIEGWDWSIIDRKAVTRAEGDNVNDLLAINEISRGDGEMIVSLKSKKSIADLNEDEIAIFALNGTNTANGNNIASDYAKVTSEDLKNFAIVNASLTHEFAFRDPYPTEKPTEPAQGPASARIDAELVYSDKTGIDLKDLVWTWAKDINVLTSTQVTLENLNIDGLTYTFEKPEKYLGSDGITNQQDFVNLDGSIVTVNDYATAAIGRTPIFLVKALVNGTVVASGYIKLEIVKSAPEPDKPDEILTVDCGTINYGDIVDSKVIAELDWTRVNKFYSQYGLTAKTFSELYENAVNTKTETGVIMDGKAWMGSQTTTAPATFALTNNVAVMGLQEAVRTAEITFATKAGVDKTKYPNVVVRFTYTIKDTTVFPALNDDYRIDVNGDGVKDNVVKVKGQLKDSKWAMVSGIKEHFTEYLNGYKRSANHYDLYATLVAGQTGAEITPAKTTSGNQAQGKETVMAQEIKLTTELINAYKDYAVNFNVRLANGEDTTYTYTVRFERPYTVKVSDVVLETLLAEASTDELSKKVVIYGPQGEKVYENGAVTADGGNTYKFNQSGYSIEYKDLTGSTEDTWASFGGNLKLDKTTGKISWYNQGTALQKDKLAHSNVVVTIPDVAVIEAEGNIIVKKSK